MKILIFLLISISCFSQCDIPIINPILTGCFSIKYKNPTWIKYKLYKGGGDCSRDKMHFHRSDFSSTSGDYSHSGYDEGHLANAEDFAYDCEKEVCTFWFYNCIPQTPNLNRGIWKMDETFIRGLSQNDSLLIMCGPGYSDSTIVIGDGLRVPNYCWKYVISLTDKKIIMCRVYTNKFKNNSYREYLKEDLEAILNFKLE